MVSPWQFQFKDSKSRLRHLWETRTASDCRFLVGIETKVEVQAHKALLSAASPVIDEKLREASDGSVIVLSDIEPEIFEEMLKYIYIDLVDIKSSDVAERLGKAARDYKLPHLAMECYKYEAKTLNVKNVWEGYELAICTQDKDFIVKCEEFIKTKTKEVLKDNRIEIISIDTLAGVFSMESLNIDSELDLLEAADKYYASVSSKDDVTIKMVDMMKALKNIRFLSLPAHLFAEAKTHSKVLVGSDACAILSNIVSGSSGETMPDGFSISLQSRGKKDNNDTIIEAKFRFVVHDYKELKKSAYSPTVIVRNLPWKLEVDPVRAKNYLSVYLNGFRSKSVTWNCKTFVEISLVRDGEKSTSSSFTHVFKATELGWGFNEYIELEKILDPKNKYLHNGALIFEVTVRPEKPNL